MRDYLPEVDQTVTFQKNSQRLSRESLDTQRSIDERLARLEEDNRSRQKADGINRAIQIALLVIGLLTLVSSVIGVVLQYLARP